MEKDLSVLEQKIGVKFNDQEFLRQALVHRSYINENPDFRLGHNERLEFLGDAVLELAVTEDLFKTYKNPEGELTNWRAALVNAKTLAEVGGGLELDNFIYLSKGESRDTGRARQYIIANAMEALIGAMYLDSGFATVKKFVQDKIIILLPKIIESGLYKDSKSFFQEKAQELTGITPSYEVLKEWGPDHAKNFLIGVFLENEKIAEGEGLSKQEAQQVAAENALQAKGWSGPV